MFTLSISLRAIAFVSSFACASFAIAAPTGPTTVQDLGKIYSGTLDFAKDVGAVDWHAGPGDVWQVSRFEYECKGKLSFAMGPSTVVIGKNDSKDTGSSAVWAAVFPDEPAELTSSEPGHGDHARAVFMRFHPSRVGELFPSDSVTGQGDASWLVWAKRQSGHKMGSSWQWDNLPVVPWKKSIVFDFDTVEGKRRFYMVDTDESKVTYEPAFAGRVLPVVEPDGLKSKEAVKTFRAVWSAFDKEYAMFGLKPDVDWEALGNLYEPLAGKAQSSYELAGVIGLLLSELQDLHVYVKQGPNYIPGYNRFRVTNANWKAVQGRLEGMEKRKGLTFGRVDGNVGYICIWNLSTPDLSDTFDSALESISDTTGLIVDLRFNGGGDETLGQRIAGRFLAKEAVYSKNQYRNGKKHKNLGKKLSRKFEPRGPWRYQAPVVLLQGQKTMSSAESTALMFAQCKTVTTLGDRTAGSSANPRRLELPGDIIVNLPRWIDLDPKGKPIDGVGVEPDVVSPANNPSHFKQGDPVFEQALTLLRKSKNKKPGKR